MSANDLINRRRRRDDGIPPTLRRRRDENPQYPRGFFWSDAFAPMLSVKEEAIPLSFLQNENEVSWGCASCSLGFHSHRDYDDHLNEKIFYERCRDVFPTQRSHEEVHYKTKQSTDSTIDCPNCYRIFDTLDNMKDHHKTVHSDQPTSRREMCFVCNGAFRSRTLRDQHMVSHFPTLVDRIMLKIDHLHELRPHAFLTNQCPLCQFVVTTRKSLRQHALFQHIFRIPATFSLLIGQSEAEIDDKELRIARRISSNPQLIWKRSQEKPKKLKTVKKEVIIKVEEN